MSVLDLFDLRGKVSIITGGGDGLGRMIATGLAEAGSDIVICSRKLDKCEETAHELEKLGIKSLAIQCDISRDEDLDRVINETGRKFQRIDILVNNSGRTWGGSPEDIQAEDWQRVIDLNLSGTFRVTQKVGRMMIQQRGGRIINISSYTGIRGIDPEILNAIPYSTSKGALIIFTKDLAVKWAKHNIKVNCIAPGWFPTKMTKWTLDNVTDKILSRLLIKRLGKEDDIKGVIIFLASKASDYITGQVICIDGGLSVW
jgi:NAD(P)-dependent dehydrogenase (short-subunit alcohol dehydrogenase family)